MVIWQQFTDPVGLISFEKEPGKDHMSKKEIKKHPCGLCHLLCTDLMSINLHDSCPGVATAVSHSFKVAIGFGGEPFGAEYVHTTFQRSGKKNQNREKQNYKQSVTLHTKERVVLWVGLNVTQLREWPTIFDSDVEVQELFIDESNAKRWTKVWIFRHYYTIDSVPTDNLLHTYLWWWSSARIIFRLFVRLFALLWSINKFWFNLVHFLGLHD